jgi:hypothetical protein
LATAIHSLLELGDTIAQRRETPPREQSLPLLAVPPQLVNAPKRYVVGPASVWPLDKSREVVSMNFCPLDISRRASSARALISSFSHS